MRKPRLHVPAAFHQLTLRGNHRQDIFFHPMIELISMSSWAKSSRVCINRSGVSPKPAKLWYSAGLPDSLGWRMLQHAEMAKTPRGEF